jgi:hypothetical protein
MANKTDKKEEKGNGYKLLTNIEHNGTLYETGTVIEEWFGKQDELEALLASGALEAYQPPKTRDVR